MDFDFVVTKEEKLEAAAVTAAALAMAKTIARVRAMEEQ